ncbi:peptide chain release factor 1-like, mitochondrial [Caerostris extrusa]|uniref:Peptide chain release factor 1-like, mitochondrial n=1 Tax=Caerostris extrusa TaxID=172846 RepID=A0AAV4TKY4_CAEEX|nr:peptide chain release factor 1-like, mitochondrial [Caerostris extrusa]
MLFQLIIPIDVVDDKDIIMELSAGVGGQEAMLFAKDLFDMYCHYARWKGWNAEILKYDSTGIGGIRSAHIAINGQNAFKVFKYESGVHRVQRVPKTEKAGRIHTSTMTVAVLPQPSEIEVVIHPNDIELEFKRSSGAGGQHVNTTDSCVRIYHKPSGIVTECQMERNQHRNRELAMKSLRAKLYERQLEAIIKETTSSRKLQVGTAGRSEKVRTYNFPQDRITDHRAHLTVHVATFNVTPQAHQTTKISRMGKESSGKRTKGIAQYIETKNRFEYLPFSVKDEQFPEFFCRSHESYLKENTTATRNHIQQNKLDDNKEET